MYDILSVKCGFFCTKLTEPTKEGLSVLLINYFSSSFIQQLIVKSATTQLYMYYK